MGEINFDFDVCNYEIDGIDLSFLSFNNFKAVQFEYIINGSTYISSIYLYRLSEVIVQFLNGEYLLGSSFPKKYASHAEWFDKYAPSEEERKIIEMNMYFYMRRIFDVGKLPNLEFDCKIYSSIMDKKTAEYKDGNSIDFHYVVKRPFDALCLICSRLIDAGEHICKCENCGKYFSPSVRKIEKYCNNVFDKKSGKTCKEIGYQRSLKDVDKEYRTAYKTRNAYKNRNISNRPWVTAAFQEWVYAASLAKEQYKAGEIKYMEYKKILSRSLSDIYKGDKNNGEN
ncbi:MAG: DUF6076 domain-containing protein [Acutalibacteraceae bacterium]